MIIIFAITINFSFICFIKQMNKEISISIKYLNLFVTGL